MKLGIIRLYCGESGKKGFYNLQEVGLAKALVKKGIKVDIFFLSSDLNEDFKIEEIDKNIRIITLKSKKIMNHGIISPDFLKEFKVDVVHLLSDNQIGAPRIIEYCKKNNIPCYCYVGTISSDSENWIKRNVMNLLSKRNIKAYKNVTTICKTTEVEKQLKKMGVSQTKVIPVGLDIDLIPKIESTNYEIKKELGLSDKKILLFVGRLEEYKKPLEFVELIKYIKNKTDSYRAVIIGNGSLKKIVEEKIDKYGLEEIILIVDKVENKNIHKYYKIADAFINMNDKEIFGMSILEAMYQGCPVIAHSAPGPNYIIDSGVNGIIVNSYNKEIWFNNIELVTNEKSFRINAKKRIVDDLNWNCISDKFLEVINEKGVFE